MAHQKSSTRTLTTKKSLPMTVRYFRKPGSHIPAKLIPVIVEELQSITGNATLRGAGDAKVAEQLVATAKPDSHPLHDWIYRRPAGEIAHEYYLNRAREAIRSVGVEIVIKNGVPPIRQRFVIYSQRADGYVPYTRVLTVKTLRQEDINHGLTELRLWLQRYGIIRNWRLWQARSQKPSRGLPPRNYARQASGQGMARRGPARPGLAGHGAAWLGRRGAAWRGLARPGKARRGLAWQARHDTGRPGNKHRR